MQPKEIHLLIEKYFAGTATPDESKILEDWYKEQSNKKSEWILEDKNEEHLRLQMLSNIQNHINRQNTVVIKHIRWRRIIAAASILIFFSIAYFWFKPANVQPQKTVKTNIQRYKNDIAPGGNKAILTLADGSHIVLDDAKNGVLGKQGNIIVNKAKDGQIIYNQSGTQTNSQVNNIATPKGGQYQIILSDGTKVWLNAASSLKYPTTFTGKQRDVELSGEAYFEVAKNKYMPFKVKVNDMEIEVLGTHFNVMAYQNENNINTTLLEGSVKVVKGTTSRVIVPGQHALVNNNTGKINVQPADIDEAVAWQKGYYVFKNEDIKSIMRKIDRWYDVDVVYNGNIDDKTFSGKISRFKKISAVLQLLELTEDVRFKLEGRRITVMP